MTGPEKPLRSLASAPAVERVGDRAAGVAVVERRLGGVEEHVVGRRSRQWCAAASRTGSAAGPRRRAARRRARGGRRVRRSPARRPASRCSRCPGRSGPGSRRAARRATRRGSAGCAPARAARAGRGDRRCVLLRGVGADHVRAGGRQELARCQVDGRVLRHRGGARQRQLVEELRRRLGEVEGHRAGPVVGGDALAQVAVRSRLAWRPGPSSPRPRRPAHRRSPPRRYPGAVAGVHDGAFDAAPDVTGQHRRPGGVAHPLAQVERVGEPAVGRCRQGGGQVRDQPGPCDPTRAAEADQTVVGQRGQPPGLLVVTGRWGRGRAGRPATRT